MDVDYEEEERPSRTKGRGRRSQESDDRYEGKAGDFEQLRAAEDDDVVGPARSIEGWVIMVSNVHEEAQEDDLIELFAEYGEIKHMHLNLDRRTGFVKGYCLLEYESFSEAQNAIKELNGTELLDKDITANWAFSKAPEKRRKKR